MSKLIKDWTVDYGQGPKAVQVPHAWKQDVPLLWEGPATYVATVNVPDRPSWLVFHGVSYAATVRVAGQHAGEHRGLWDAFSVSLARFQGQTVDVEVEVVKNGGKRYPVKDVASGFLPYVMGTFGGIYQDVELVECGSDPLAEPPMAPDTRTTVEGSRIYIDGNPTYFRGVLTWGWYPDLGHCNPPEDEIRREVRQIKSLGFNLVKFCLWVPPHRYLDALREEGMFAWLELPLWDPTPDSEHQDRMAHEFERIVRQYRRHEHIVFWTAGCELSASTSPEYRRRLVEIVRRLTGSPLIKDNSGGAEMYGGDPREYGDFYDFHPYCETHFYPLVLDSLMPGPRTSMPVLLGEFNDYDIHRDLPRIQSEKPYWSSTDPDLNAQGVRWQFDLGHILADSPFAGRDERRHRALAESTHNKALFIRKTVQESVRAHDPIGGYVVTGWRDTPISTAGFQDDWGQTRYRPEEIASWNSPDVLFLIPRRRPPWLRGGNRPGYDSPCNFFAGTVLLQIGCHSESGFTDSLQWSLESEASEVANGRIDSVVAKPLTSMQVAEVCIQLDQPGEYRLRASVGPASNEWSIWVHEKPSFGEFREWSSYDPMGLLDGTKFCDGPNLVATRAPDDLLARLDSGACVILLETIEHVLPRPFWRECGFEFADPAFWTRLAGADRLERLLPIAPDAVVDPAYLADLGSPYEVLLNRVDTRTYEELPIMARMRRGRGVLLVTTLRPFGGLGDQPYSVEHNASGSSLLSGLMRALAAGASPYAVTEAG